MIIELGTLAEVTRNTAVPGGLDMIGFTQIHE